MVNVKLGLQWDCDCIIFQGWRLIKINHSTRDLINCHRGIKQNKKIIPIQPHILNQWKDQPPLQLMYFWNVINVFSQKWPAQFISPTICWMNECYGGPQTRPEIVCEWLQFGAVTRYAQGPDSWTYAYKMSNRSLVRSTNHNVLICLPNNEEAETTTSSTKTTHVTDKAIEILIRVTGNQETSQHRTGKMLIIMYGIGRME